MIGGTRRALALAVGLLLSPLLPGVASPAPRIAPAGGEPPCERPKTYTEFAERERYRSLLEDFRETLEGGREALEAERAAALIDHPTYVQRLVEYRHAIAAYREGIAGYRESRCRYIRNQILTVRVEGAKPGVTDEVAVRVTYYYTGDRGEGIGMEAITQLDGPSTGHWAYKPARVALGLNVAIIALGMNKDAPDTYESTELLIGFFRPGAEVFDERVVAFTKTWLRATK